MRTTQAARYARWSAAVALLLATVVSGVYARRAWQAHLAQLTMHPSVPSSVQQQTAGFSLSKVTGDRTEFTVRASHATEFTEGGRSVLQDVWFTAYGQDGQRFDNLHTRSCDYIERTGDINLRRQRSDRSPERRGCPASPEHAVARRPERANRAHRHQRSLLQSRHGFGYHRSARDVPFPARRRPCHRFSL